MAWLLSLPGKIAMAALALVLAYGAGYYGGASGAKAKARAEALQATLDQLKERNATDEQIRDMDDAALCQLLGGVFTDGECQ